MFVLPAFTQPSSIIMRLLPRPIIFHLILFISCSFGLGRAADCGGKNVANTITVDQNGKGAFKAIQAAIDSVKSNNDRWVKIHINPGTYMEKVHIPIEKPCIILEGAGSESTIVTFSDRKTSSNATFIASPPNVVVIGITFKNSYNLALFSKLQNMAARIEPAGAAAIYGDKTSFSKCSFMSFQDTLFDVRGRHYFKNCYIQGEVDFICGSGQSYFENCTINATQGNSRKAPGYITAQHRDSPNDPDGFVFEGGSVVGSGQVNLGRAWGPYSRVIFIGTHFSSVVTPQGWSAWNFGSHENQLTYAEVNCTGPGANISRRVQWSKKQLSPAELNEYSLSSFIDKDGWLANIPTIL